MPSSEPSLPLRPLRGLVRIVVGTVATVCAAAMPVGAQAQQTVLRVGHFPNVTHVQALVARQMERQGKSWFADRLGGHVKIEWYPYNAGPSAMEAILANSIDLTYVGPNPALNTYVRSRGQEVRVIAGAVNGASALVVQGDGKLAQPSDFRGKRIGTPQFGNTQDVSARAWLIAGGLRITPSGGDAQVLPTANADQLTLFLGKKLDAVWTVEPWVSRLELEAGGRVLVEEKDALTTVLVARAKFLAEQRELVRRFAAAHRDLSDWIRRNPEQAQHLVREELRTRFRVSLSAELVAHAWPRMTMTSEISLADFQKFVASAQKVGFLREAGDLSRLIEIP